MAYPPHAEFVRWVQTQAAQVPRKHLLRRIRQEQLAEAQAEDFFRPIFRRAQPQQARALQEKIRQITRGELAKEKDPDPAPSSAPKKSCPKT